MHIYDEFSVRVHQVALRLFIILYMICAQVQASIAQSATQASGCIHNLTSTAEIALDDCVMKTCKAVCYDVVRKCPKKVSCAVIDAYHCVSTYQNEPGRHRMNTKKQNRNDSRLLFLFS